MGRRELSRKMRPEREAGITKGFAYYIKKSDLCRVELWKGIERF